MHKLILALLLTITTANAFDQDRAFMLLKAQVAFGPRVPNSVAADSCREFLRRELSFWCDTAWVQPFTYNSADRGTTLKLYNIVGQINPQSNARRA